MGIDFSYRQVVEEIFKIRPQKGESDPSVMGRLLSIRGNPQLRYPAIHIAGTNGKGQVATKIATALGKSGYKVGLFISPHLIDYEERIRVAEKLISKERIVEYYLELKKIGDREGIRPHFFESTTYFGLCHFADEEVDIAVVEVGLGGGLDPTMAVNSSLAVITSISLDHTDYLGETIEEISLHKAGIIRQAVPLVLGPRANLPPIIERARQLCAPCHIAKEGGSFYDEENRNIAREALMVISERFTLSPEVIEEGLTARLPCRFEEKKGWIFDVAHNPDGFRKLAAALRHFYPGSPVRFVVGMSRDKDIRGSLQEIAPLASHIHFIQPVAERGAIPGELVKILHSLEKAPPCSAEETISMGIELAERQRQQGEILVVCGSFYIMKEARQALGV